MFIDQDIFRISPHGVIQFAATGTPALVSVLREETTGLSGTDGPNAISITDNRPRTLTARAPRGGKFASQHKVFIGCCTDASCSTTTEANASDTSSWFDGKDDNSNHGGPNVDARNAQKPAPGGPVLHVEDE